MKNETETGFLGFILDAQKDKALFDKFMKIENLKDLQDFFKKKHRGYGITDAQVLAMWDARLEYCDQYGEETIAKFICGGRGY